MNTNTAMEKDKDGEQAKKQAEFLVDLGFGGLFKGVTDLVGQISNTVESLKVEGDEQSGEFTIKGLGDEAKGVYGFSIRTAGGGKTRVEPFGNMRSTEKGPEVADAREPLVDVFDEENEVLITAELPGVSEDQIEVVIEEDILTLQTSGDRKYAKEMLLPGAVDRNSLTKKYNNGILEIRIAKVKS